MRPALILPALVSLALLSACGDKASGPTDPERRSAAGEILGGEITDDMLPLDTVRSTSPAGRSGASEDGTEEAVSKERPRAPLPEPEVSESPEPVPDVSPSVPTDGPAPE